MATRRITFRLYRKKAQAKKLHEWRKLHQYLYNACLDERRVQFERFGKSISYFDQQNLLPDFQKYWREFKELKSANQSCPNCGKKRKKELSERVHNCRCSCYLDQDIAAAQVMINGARGLGTNLLNRGVEASTATPAYCGGFKQASMMKRQKLRPQP